MKEKDKDEGEEIVTCASNLDQNKISIIAGFQIKA